MKINKSDLYWIAGLLEGEGSFGRKGGGTNRNVRIQCHMTDLDVLQTLRVKVGRGNVNGPYANSKPEHKKRYKYDLAGGDAYLLMKILYPLMGSRRQERIAQLIAAYDAVPIKKYRIKNISTGRVEETTNLTEWMCSKDMKSSCAANLYETISGRRRHYKGWKRLS